jgi:peroxiredoxin family protein
MQGLAKVPIGDPDLIARILALESEVAAMKDASRRADTHPDKNGVSLVVFSGTLDKLLAAMNIATGAASMGCEVHLFFTFWGTSAMRRDESSGKKSVMEKILGMMLPAGVEELKLSTMHMGGIGTAMIKRRMKRKNILNLDKLFQMAEELGVKISICEMSLDLMGMTMDDLRCYPCTEVCGVGTFMAHALESKVTLFI